MNHETFSLLLHQTLPRLTSQTRWGSPDLCHCAGHAAAQCSSAPRGWRRHEAPATTEGKKCLVGCVCVVVMKYRVHRLKHTSLWRKSRASWIRMAMFLGEKKVWKGRRNGWKTVKRSQTKTGGQCKWKETCESCSRCQCRSHRCHCRQWTWWSLSSRFGNQCAVKEKQPQLCPSVSTQIHLMIVANFAGLTLSVFIRVTRVRTCATMSLKKEGEKNHF